MEELEARLAALETLFMERLALDPPAMLRALQAQLDVEAFGDERMIRDQALHILGDAIRRFDEISVGFRIPTPPAAES